MNPIENKIIADAISPARLAPYLRACGGDLEVALRLYTWNKEIVGAFSGSLSELEVVLRNAMDRRLTSHFGGRDWWASPRIRLAPHARDKITAVAMPKAGAIPTADDVVAGLTFGFWESLLGRKHNYESHLWWPALRDAFPGYSGVRGPLHADVYNLRLFRNRISHCEPIHGRHLEQDNRTLLKILDYISPEAARCVARFSRVQEVLDRRASVLDGSLTPRF
ncbi:hypothetical protein [Nonomuraea sp. NPDC048901]|uniref:hypothetical protein n=1 Tax=Nonomuraea sp. NPDC048901 TaxID=3155627 RepID=UPI0033FEDEF3